MFYAWSLLEHLPRRDWYDAVQPTLLTGGDALIRCYRSQLRQISADPSHAQHAIACELVDEAHYAECPPRGKDGTYDLNFWLGSPRDEPKRQGDEPIQHRAKLDEPFRLSQFLVTNRQYELFDPHHQRRFKSNEQGESTDRHPVVGVDWFDAWCFCAWLGDTYRLPTEKEWEFACRAGTRTPYSFGTKCNGVEANCDGNYPYGTEKKGPYLEQTSVVGSYAANAFGLYDMHGNAWEWCASWYANDLAEGESREFRASARVLRGGSWGSVAWFCRSSSRYRPTSRHVNVGFRVARALLRKS
jgi:formylglycine-generating enzyme required for sulfatase activity